MKIPSVVAEHPLVPDVLVHNGCTDISSQSSEPLKQDFMKLIDFFTVHGRRLFLSGPIPGRFSLHTWLQSTCAALNVAFIDNFNLFWKRPGFFRPDGPGSRTLTDNILYSIWNSP